MTGRYPSPRALLDKYELRAKKSWGQNFLGDEGILDDIARLAAPGAGDAVVGNLPYHLTSPILFSLLDQLEHVSRAVFLLQREVAERLAARPGSHDWGLASVFLQREADVSVERIVPPGAFVPPPNVESAVLCALFRAPTDAVAVPERFRRLVKAGFAQRRKTLRNALEAARIAPPERLAEALARAPVEVPFSSPARGRSPPTPPR